MPSRFQVAPKAERTVDGIVFASKREAKRYVELRMLERAGEIEHLKLQPSWVVEINGFRLCKYSADFSFWDKMSDRTVIEDVKSRGTSLDPAYRLRKKAAELAHGIKVTEVY